MRDIVLSTFHTLFERPNNSARYALNIPILQMKSSYLPTVIPLESGGMPPGSAAQLCMVYQYLVLPRLLTGYFS